MGSNGPYGLPKEEVIKRFNEYTVAVYGFGKMGQPIGGVFAKHGAKVIAVDIDKRIVEAVNEGKATVDEPIELDGNVVSLTEAFSKFVAEGRLKATTNAIEAAKEADIHVVIVPTLLKEGFYPDLSALKDVTKKISKGLKDGDLVIVESTVPPGTMKEVVYPILKRSKKEFGLAYSPERTYSGRVTFDIEKRYPKIVGSDDPKALEAASGIYSVISEKGVIELPSRIEAEVTKVFEGVYRDVNIALANELAKACEELGCDFYRIRYAANSQPYSHIHLPGAGVGGHCIPVYPRFLIYSLKNNRLELTRLAREINRYDAPKRVVDLMLRASYMAGVVPKRVIIMGLAYRGGVKEMRYSPTLRILEELEELGIKPYLYDPMRTKEEIKELKKRVPILKTVYKTYTNDLNDVLNRIRKIRIVVLVTNHKEVDEFLERMPVDRKGAIVDARVMQHYDGEKDVTIEKLRNVLKSGRVIYARLGSKPVRMP